MIAAKKVQEEQMIVKKVRIKRKREVKIHTHRHTDRHYHSSSNCYSPSSAFYAVCDMLATDQNSDEE